MTSQEFSVISNLPSYLFLSSSCGRSCAAIFNTKSVVEESFNLNPKQHSEWIFPAITDLLKKSKLQIDSLSGVVFDRGPGSFTGVRLGVSLAKTFSFAADLPILGLTSLELLLQNSEPKSFAAINAFGNKFYVQSRGFKYDDGPRIITVQDLIKDLPEAVQGRVQLVGDGFSKLPGMEFDSQLPLHYPTAEAARNLSLLESNSKLWTNDWKSVLPLYLRRSEAEERINGESNSLGNRIR